MKENKLQADRKKQIRERVAACRARKKQGNSNNDQIPSSTAFKSAQAFGTAVSRANRALTPASSNTTKRKRAVV